MHRAYWGVGVGGGLGWGGGGLFPALRRRQVGWERTRVDKSRLAAEQAALTPSGLTSASLLVRVEDVPLPAPAGV